MATKPYPVASIIQGISQQAIHHRRDSQCEDQENCVNSPVDGVRDRPGSILTKFLASADYSDAFFYFIDRSADEKYVVIVLDGDLKVFNVLTGVEATVTFSAAKTYLDAPTGKVADSFAAVSIEDTTLIGNKTIAPAMNSGDVAPDAVNECLVYIRAGNYQMEYTLGIDYGGTKRRWSYRTATQASTPPDDDNAITTDQIAASFYRALTGNTASGSSGGIIGGTYNGDPGWAAGGPDARKNSIVTTPGYTLTSLGFTVQLNGNVLRIARGDANPFTLDVADGNGGNNMTGIQGAVQAFADLPNNCFDGVIVKVRGNKTDVDDDYYVKFEGSGRSGSWVECPKPGLKLSLDAATMPHQLLNTGLNTFTWSRPTWSKRISGDGDKTSPEPSFVGKLLKDLTYDNARFGILTAASQVWSKTSNAFTFFADTAKTKLATAPVDLDIAYKKPSILERFIQAGELSMVWAPGVQFRIDSTDQGFKEDTVSAKPAKNYEFSHKAAPVAVADSLYFATEQLNFAMIRDLLIRQERILGAVPITAHVPRLIPNGVRHLVGGDSLSMLFAGSLGLPNVLFNYAWLFGENEERVQSAWNKWTFPSSSNIVWVAVSETKIFLGVQRPGGFSLEYMDLAFTSRDPGESDYTTQLDMRCYGGASPGSGWVGVTSITYNAGTNRTTFVMPFAPSEAVADPSKLVVVTRTATADVTRGTIFKVLSVSGSTVTVQGNLTGLNFFVGWRVITRQELSQLVVKDDNGNVLLPTRLDIKELRVAYANTAYFRIEVVVPGGRTYKSEYQGRHPEKSSGGIQQGTGFLVQGVSNPADGARITLINDSPFPSAWTGLLWLYDTTDPALKG
ncbi:hypothetical protein [Taklimakanibacter albus]|uniref:Uncharacterized protein n=1 Tax=Taklimakanibacter albus TaxID=2800327 RepID=A0ACC5RFT9_9HYPH|nr:hypothetical protein [Aestuariivirga sp. YIM B02566]MBK1871571.1 hypothetical protein [Aestuariivirga sp. YIM B02566]